MTTSSPFSVRCLAIPFAPLLVLATTGCLHEGMERAQTAEDLPGEAVTPERTELRDVAVPSDDDDDTDDEGSPEQAVAPAPAGAALPSRLPPPPALFRLGAGYGALGRIDLAPCRGQGLQAGYLHMRVTFRDSGRIVRAAVESPVPPPGEALTCIGEQLSLAMVPVFEGDEVTLSKSFFVN